MKMKKIMFLLAAVIAVSLSPLKAYADQSDEPRVVDEVGILSEEEYNAIESTLLSASEEYDMDIVLFFESASPEEYQDDYGDECAMYYCADLFDYGGYTDNGLALLVTVDERKWALVTEGEGDTIFNSNVQSTISNNFLPYLQDDDFAGAGQEYADYVSYYYDATQSEGEEEEYTYDDSFDLAFEWEMLDKFMVIVVALVLGLIVALIRILRLRGQLVSVRSQNFAGNYVVEDSMNLRSRMDTYLYTTETRTKIEKHEDNDNSFTSSSGDEHTGSTGSF